MNKKDKIKNIVPILKNTYGEVKIALNYETLYQLIIAVLLSAQCTDKRVNIVTEEFFKYVREPIDIYNMEIEEIEKYIKSTGFYKNKAKNIKENARQIIEDYNNKIPDNMEELTKLAGVGRKTANVVLGDYFKKISGIVVDTHVRRITNLIGLVKTENPEIIEKELMKIIPKKYWYEFSHLLILHGRNICIARRPKCKDCVINKYCSYGIKNTKKI